MGIWAELRREPRYSSRLLAVNGQSSGYKLRMKVPRGTFPKREVFYSKWVGEHFAEGPHRTMREGCGTVRLPREFRFSGDRLLDPNTCIAAINGTPGGGAPRLQRACPPESESLLPRRCCTNCGTGWVKAREHLPTPSALPCFYRVRFPCFLLKSRIRRRPARFERSLRPPESRLARTTYCLRDWPSIGSRQGILAREGTELGGLGEGLVTAVFRSNMYALSRCQRPLLLRPKLKCAGRNRTLLRRHPNRRFVARSE